MDDIKGIRTIILTEGTAEEMRKKIRHYFHQTYTIDEKLYETLKYDETFYKRADALRHPLIFYLGHTAVFYINKLNVAKLINQRINPSFESMFAVGVDEMSWDDLNEAHYDWSTVSEVKAYRNKVRNFVDELICTMPLDMPINWNNPWWAIMMGIEHQRIHLETSSVLIRQLPLEEVQQLDFWAICSITGKAPENEMLLVKGSRIELGKKRDHPLYGWDNEYGSYFEEIKDFKASKYLVSNKEFLPFIEDGGYDNPKWWTEEGWNWNCFRKLGMPLFWKKDENNNYLLRTMASLIPMPWDWPVEVNYLEAKAFTNWLADKTGRSLRLPTEAEWYCLRDACIKTDQPYWEKAPANINLEYFASSCPVNMFKHGDFYDVIGNVWQWTETPIFGFDGFEAHPYYDDFSVPTFDNKHNLIKGGSWISTGNEATRDSRYAFRRHFYQHAGFRYVESNNSVFIKQDLPYSEPDVVSFCEEQWNKNNKMGESFSKRIIKEIMQIISKRLLNNALIVGCKTGRSAFELARYVPKVIGLDFTARFIQVCVELKEKGRIRYQIPLEGNLSTYQEVALDDFGLSEVSDKIEFWQADASNLVAKFTGYDLILLDEVLTETYDPKGLLQTIHTRINPSGILIIASSYYWNDKEETSSIRLGGYRKDGEPYTAYDEIKELLKSNFKELYQPLDLPMYLPIDRRNYHYSEKQITFWCKKDIK